MFPFISAYFYFFFRGFG